MGNSRYQLNEVVARLACRLLSADDWSLLRGSTIVRAGCWRICGTRDCIEGCSHELNQGRLNQWAHWARAQSSLIFPLFEDLPTGCGEINFFKLIILLLVLLHERTNTSSAYLVNLT